MAKSSDVVIVGGGIIGCSIAYHLAKKGVKPTVVERESVGSQASGAATGLLVSLSSVEEEGFFYELTSESCKHHKEIIPELEELSRIDVRYGGFQWLDMALNDEEERGIKREHQWKLDHPEASWLSGDEIRRLDPRITPRVQAGVLIEHQAQVDPYRLTMAFAGAAEALGATIKYAQVTGLMSQGGRASGVSTSQGEITADTVVFAMGSWTRDVGDWIGMPVPVIPLKGQTIQLQISGPELPGMVHHGVNYVCQKLAGVVIAGTFDGHLGYDLTIHEEGKEFILKGVEEIYPGLMDSKIVTHITGLRPDTLDSLPIMGRVPGLEGAYIATGHRRLGITLSAITGELMSQLILTGKTRLSLESYRLDRFDGREVVRYEKLDAVH